MRAGSARYSILTLGSRTSWTSWCNFSHGQINRFDDRCWDLKWPYLQWDVDLQHKYNETIWHRTYNTEGGRDSSENQDNHSTVVIRWIWGIPRRQCCRDYVLVHRWSWDYNMRFSHQRNYSSSPRRAQYLTHHFIFWIQNGYRGRGPNVRVPWTLQGFPNIFVERLTLMSTQL